MYPPVYTPLGGLLCYDVDILRFRNCSEAKLLSFLELNYVSTQSTQFSDVFNGHLFSDFINGFFFVWFFFFAALLSAFNENYEGVFLAAHFYWNQADQ